MYTPHAADHGPSRPRARASRRLLRFAATGLLAAVSAACAREAPGAERDAAPPPVGTQQFTAMPTSYTGVRFENRVRDDDEVNVFTYRNFYNGGGVAIGDLTGDGLPELVLTSNQDGPTLYLNGGAFRFRDVTRRSGLRTAAKSWTTGVTLADVNGDGRLDIYLCRAGPGAPATRRNQLWINQGAGADSVPTFVEVAERYGVADEGYSTQAAFLDHDRDGDLDLFVVNNSPRPASSFGVRNTRHVRDPYGGAKLFRNDGERFTDVSAQAGIHSPEVAFGLGLAVSDVNRDGWPDVYVSNDFFERDYLYVNRRDGTFDEGLDRRTSVVSYFSMGLDVADVDNDGWPDVYTTDMLPEDETRLKTTTTFEGWDVYQAKVRNGYHHQSMRNMLQHNNGDAAPGAGQAPTFSEVGQMAGVARTDWSWGALIADLDLDGQKDVFVTNGIAKDITSQDYVAFLANETTMRDATQGGRAGVDFRRLTRAMTSTPIASYAFRNVGGLRFESVAPAWGLATPAFSSGAAYGDLDGDGAPELVVNHVDRVASVYRNNARALGRNHFVQLRTEGAGKNRFAVGARVTVHAGDLHATQEVAPTRGFQSSVDYTLSFGLGARGAVDSVSVAWPDGRSSVVRDVAVDRRHTVRQADAATPAGAGGDSAAAGRAILADVTARAGIEFVHRENDFVDFDRERLLPKLLSTEGPALAVADVNDDGRDDVFIGGAKGQPGQLLVQDAAGRFVARNPGLFERSADAEDVGAIFFDANGDRRPDLYVVSGGSEYSDLAPALQDRLYLNDGGGRFHHAADALPPESASGSRVAAGDVDGDGDADLFVGARVVPWRYGADPRSALLRNDGRGHFTDVTAQLAPELERVGMVTDAVWRDVDGDRRVDLVVVGEWMPITLFRNGGGGRLARADVPGLAQSGGWWNRIVAGDFTGDGRVDFVVGNLGLNARLRATPAAPATMHVKDFDRNGSVEQIIAYHNDGASYPLALRDDLVKALPFLKARYPGYARYARQRVTDVFRPDELAGAAVKSVHTFETSLARNNGDGSFTLVPLPREAQVAPVHAILATDADGDGHTDLLLAGNFDGVKPELGRMSAGRGLLLRGDPSRCGSQDGGCAPFTPVHAAESGFRVPGQTRDIQRVRGALGDLVVVGRNNDRPLVFAPGPGRAAAHVARRPGTRAARDSARTN